MSEPFADEEYGEGSSGGSPLPAFLLDPRGVLDRRWPWMVTALVLGLIATAAATYIVKPRYAATASVLVSSQEIPQEFVRSTVQGSSLSNLNATISQVLSNANLERIIEQLDLFADERDRVPIEALVGRLRRNLGITPETKVAKGVGKRGETSTVYSLAFESGEPMAAANVTNAMAALVVEASITQRNEQAARITRFLQSALADDERELREQSRLVSEFRRANRGHLPEELDTNMQKLEMLNNRQASLQTQIAQSEGRILELGARRATADRTNNELLLEELRVQLARESAVNTEEHPSVISLRRRVANLEALVESEAAGSGGNDVSGEAAILIDGERRGIARMREEIAKADAEVADLAARIDKTPSTGEQLSALEQKESVLREDYIGALRKVEQAELAETLELSQQGAQASVLNRATPPSSPILPRWMLVVAGIVASLGLALGIAVLLELVDPVVVDLGQLEKLAEQPVLGGVPWVRG